MRTRGFACAAIVLAACGGESASIGLDEPIRVREIDSPLKPATLAQFRAGGLPGLPPLAASDDAGAPSGPHLTDVELDVHNIQPGQGDVGIHGRTSTDATAVALRMTDEGSGYWVLPVQSPDSINGGEPIWTTLCDFNASLSPGAHLLRLVAIDGAGRAGTQWEQDICITLPFNDNFNVCNPRRNKPPAAVLTLAWDGAADVNLRLVTPNGTVVGGKRFSAAAVADGGIDQAALNDPSTAKLDHDANRGCVDGSRRESIVWQGPPPAGHYLAYADLFDACATSAVRFQLSLYLAQGAADGTSRLVQQPSLGSGELLRTDANGGATLGLYVSEFDFQ